MYNSSQGTYVLFWLDSLLSSGGSAMLSAPKPLASFYVPLASHYQLMPNVILCFAKDRIAVISRLLAKVTLTPIPTLTWHQP